MKNKKTHYLVKLLTRLRFQFSHELSFRYGFSDIINPTRACGTEIKTTDHFFLRCHF